MVTVGLLIAGCAANPSPQSSEISSTPEEIISADNDDFMNVLGFKIDCELPIPIDEGYIINGSIAELRFIMDKTNIAYLRIAINPGESISGIAEKTFEQECLATIGEIPVKIDYSTGGPMQGSWEKNGYIFNFYMKKDEADLADCSFKDTLDYYVDDLKLYPTKAPF